MKKEKIKEKIKTLINKYSIPLNEEKIEKLSEFATEVIDKNKKINLISKKDEEKIVERHILDSLMFFKLNLDVSENQRLLDIGSGGGFPGIVIAIVNENLKITLAEKKSKKQLFLFWIKEKLRLKNIEILKKEVKGDEELFFDIITQRAAGKIDVIYPIAMDLLKYNGVFVSWMAKSDAISYQNKPDFIYNYYLEDRIERVICIWRK